MLGGGNLGMDQLYLAIGLNLNADNIIVIQHLDAFRSVWSQVAPTQESSSGNRG